MLWHTGCSSFFEASVTDEFKREAVALWETSGRMRTEVVAELAIMPTTLRR